LNGYERLKDLESAKEIFEKEEGKEDINEPEQK